MTVWSFESQEDIVASEYICIMFYKAREEDSYAAKRILSNIYPDDDWDTIVERMETEGSVWYVWYMDGVRNLMKIWKEERMRCPKCRGLNLYEEGTICVSYPIAGKDKDGQLLYGDPEFHTETYEEFAYPFTCRDCNIGYFYNEKEDKYYYS